MKRRARERSIREIADEPAEQEGPERSFSYVVVLLALPLAAFVVLVGYGLSSHDHANFVYARVSYWLVLGLFLVWCFVVVERLRAIGFLPLEFLRAHRGGLLFCLAVTTLVVVSVPPKFRVLSDETNLLGVSRSMLYARAVYNTTMGKWYFGNFYPVNTEFEKRPILFPFFVHLIHLVRGYDWRNGFVLNVIVLFVLLCGVFIAARRRTGPLAAASAVLLLISYPVLTLNATSAGFDLFSVAFFGLVGVALYAMLERPSGGALAFLWANLLMFSHTRYESPVLVFIVVVSLVVSNRLRLEYLRSHVWLYALTPLFVVPLMMQRYLMPDVSDLPPGQPAFSAPHFLE